ncbi:glycosyltransferase [Nocardioides bruguierae]|uniref:glycosyltransferase n=1 Tax=Nocardioides bruguierae TaxID=2945102 RepID=UPI00201FC33C|nr:glycosyltransferase [Nocardioides bruguierae]MCL8026273.1 glycosyltransferase [Nocardioides bruguierae]
MDRNSGTLVFLSHDLSNNAMGRLYSTYLIARKAGYRCVIAGAKGSALWAPVQSQLQDVEVVSFSTVEDLVHLAERTSASAFLSVKAMPSTLFPGMSAARECGLPLVLDIDDPDLDVALSRDSRLRAIAKRIRHPRQMHAFSAAHGIATRHARVITSSPALAQIYGGQIVPHVRAQRPMPGTPHHSSKPSLAFVGTPLQHKGISQLRSAVAQTQHLGTTLTVTAEAPTDAHPWERWVGRTSLEEGMRIVANTDIIAIPSLEIGYGPLQLPVKLIDAMLLGRAIIVSDLEPMTWAIGDAGLVVTPGSTRRLVDAISTLADPAARSQLGARALERARVLFDPAQYVDELKSVIEMP